MKQSERVTKVIDGDTFETAKQVVRLADVNAPELGKPGGQAAKRKLEELIQGKTVEIESVARDTYGRTVANVWVNGTSVNEAMRRFVSGASAGR